MAKPSTRDTTRRRTGLSLERRTKRTHENISEKEAALKIVSSLGAPTARGHYSQAIVHGAMVYVAGQLPIVPGEPERQLTRFEDQARRVIDNVAAILAEAGSGLDLVVKATVYIADIAQWPAFNVIYAERMGSHKPARTVVPVGTLHYGYLVEMDVIAAVRGS